MTRGSAADSVQESDPDYGLTAGRQRRSQRRRRGNAIEVIDRPRCDPSGRVPVGIRRWPSLKARGAWLNDHESDVFFVGPCNDALKLPPQFARAERFDGMSFVDLPMREQQDAIWSIDQRHYGLDAKQARPDDANWTGADIKSCCRLARLLDNPLARAALNVVTAAVTAGDKSEGLRLRASGRCLSADRAGVYSRPEAVSGGRVRRVVQTD